MQKNGGAWTELASFFKTGPFNQRNSYRYRYIPNAVGIYKFRVTNFDLPARTDTSRTIHVVRHTAGVSVKFVWDHSGNRPQDVDISGVAADGTARIIMKIIKDVGNERTISKVDIQLYDGYSVTNTKLGKLLQANFIENYNLEANTATETNLHLTSTPADSISIWYVAPDDYLRSNTDNYSEFRTVNAEFRITYTNLSQEIVTKTIEIRSPPIMLVHGLGGGSDTWDDLRFTTPIWRIDF